ncbi:lysophospholipid acyltransferase family protein [Thiohalorhabdus sp. Cl-TMA]|uniref:Lysophospholipid acyltransferase family protein n=1 Tax=Thiohalorhabdus methylotrophus TaxID=3242694 RepID=A0ABV4TTS3_9GAMM
MRRRRALPGSLRLLVRLGPLTLFLALSPLLAVLLLPASGGSRPRVVRLWSRTAARLVGLRVRVSGVPAPGGVLFAANHISWLDILAFNAVHAATFVAKREVRDWPLFGWLAARAGTVFLDRGRRSALLGAGDVLADRLRAGKPAVIFPEGTTTTGQEVAPFGPGLFRAALEAGACVQPVTLRYGAPGSPDTVAPFVGDDSLVPHLLRLLARPGTRVRVLFHEPVFPGENRQALAAEARVRVRAGLLPVPAAADSRDHESELSSLPG